MPGGKRDRSVSHNVEGFAALARRHLLVHEEIILLEVPREEKSRRQESSIS